MKSTSEILLHLSLINGIGPVTIHTIFSMVSDLACIYDYKIADWTALGVPASKAVLLVCGLEDESLLQQELDLLARYGINYISLADDRYPVLLKQTYAPPAIIYWQGVWHDLNEQAMAIIGARKANSYAKLCADMLVPDLVQHKWKIISGGALGADTFAHDAALKAGGVTVAVLGSGLLHWYPTQNASLFHRIKEQGMLLSIFPLRTQPLQGNFPARNRVIAGISQGCIVLQAEEKSGALITAKFALEYGRDVFAVPGPIHDSLSFGSHHLIKQGATLVHTSQDILEAYGYKQMDSAQQIAQEQPEDPDQDILIHVVRPASLQMLFEATQIPMDSLQQRLFDMLISGKVVQNNSGLWQKS